MMNNTRKKTATGAKYWRIKDKVILAFLLAVIVPLGLLSVVSLWNFSSLGTSISGQSGGALNEEETRAMRDLTSQKAMYLNESFDKVKREVEILVNYAQDLFNDRMNATVRPSYYHNVAASGVQPPDYVRDYGEYDRWISWNYSGYVVAPSAMATWPEPWNPAQRNTTFNALINRSSNLDVPFRQMKVSNPDYTWLYMGFEIGFHRSYPFHLYSSPYDPRSRPWYTASKINPGEVVFTSPYLDASGTGLMVTAAKTVTNESAGNAIIGCIGVDLRITTLKNNILQEQYLESGYGFLIDKLGKTIVHPQMTSVDTPITSLESSGSDFVAIRNDMELGNQGFGSYVKGGVSWLIAYYPVNVTGYSIAVVVPLAEVMEPATNIQNQILTLTGSQFAIFIVVLVAAIVVLAIVVNFVAKAIVKPVKDLTSLVGYIQQGDLSREVAISGNKAGEIGMLMKAFHNLTTILRFGNKDYYQGDLDRAFANYSSALEFFQSTGNKQGEGIAQSNLANVYHLWKDFKNAKDSYEKAINIAHQLGDKRALANRLNNLAALNSETGDVRIAEALYNEALAIDKETWDKNGEAQRLRNMAIMYTGTGEHGMAQDCLSKAQAIDMQQKYETGLCYDKFYAGLLLVKQKKIDEGLETIEKALSMAIELEDPYLRLNILKELTINYKYSSSKAKAHKYRAEYESLKRKLQPKKFVCFVLDCSGSMMQPRMKAAREGAKYIFENYVNPQDEIAIIIFHSIVEILLSPTVKAGNEQTITRIIDAIESTMYQTAFYDSLGVAIDFLNTHAKNEQRWIIALSDGQDNSSVKYCLKGSGRFQKSLDRRKPIGQYVNDNLLALNMIIVGVGDELQLVENDLKNLVTSIKRGTYIPVPDAGDISDKIKGAFHEVGEILAELEVENFDVFVEGEKGGESR